MSDKPITTTDKPATTNKSKIVEVASAPEQVTTAAIGSTVSNLQEGVAKAATGFEATQAKVKEAAEQVTTAAIGSTVSNLQEGVAKAAVGFEATQAKVKEGVEKAMKTAEELVAFNQGNIEAIVKSSQIWATGVQDLSKHIAAAAQASLDESISAFKALTGLKSLKDVFELQSSFARAALEKSLAESGKLTDASFKLTEQALAPITARVTVAVEKFAKAA
jgi:phasin family protein